MTDEDRDLAEVVIGCTNGQIGRSAAIEIIDELEGAGFAIIRQGQPALLNIEFRQVDWEPGFAGYLDNGQPNGTAFCFLNLGTLLCTVERGDLPKADLPYMIAESMMHEAIHALEAWAGVEFSEENVERLLVKYRKEAQRSGTFWQYEPPVEKTI